MAKLDVGVGDEFPTEEIRRDPDGTVHHHHYYYRRPRRPFGFLRVILTIVWIGLLFHLMRAADWTWGYDLPFLPHGYVRFATTLIGLLAVTAAIYFLRRDPGDGR
jgi:hypothetical protein